MSDHVIEVGNFSFLYCWNYVKLLEIFLFRYLYWVDTGTPARIERSRLDGTHREIFIRTNMTSPSGLTIDYDSGDLYWCDRTLDVIERVDLLQRKRNVIVTDVSDCMGLSVFGEHIYWTDV